jgi:hypothetical protein
MDASYEGFFDVMENLGFLDHIYDRLPDNFTAVFEIARILEDPSHWLSKHLDPVLKLKAPISASGEPQYEDDPRVCLYGADEPDAGLIRSFSDLPRIYPREWLLPKEVFDRRLAGRELWMPYNRVPALRSIQSHSDEFRPDNKKQKVYILLDTSSSMAIHNRIGLAKAIVYVFLRRNMKEMGAVSLRTFDTRIGELREARDSKSFKAMMTFIMRLHTLGNGTAMARGIEQAIEDIHRLPYLAGTELLIITDGACALDEDRMRELVSDTTVINTIKLGRSRLYASKSYIRDRLEEEDSEEQKQIAVLQKRVDELKRKRDTGVAPQLKRRFDESLRYAQAELDRQINALTEEIVVGYGSELERLSSMYLQVDDIDLADILACDPDRCGNLRAVYEALLGKISFRMTADDFRRLLIFGDHIAFLVSATVGPVKDMFTAFLNEIMDRVKSIVESSDPEHASLFRGMSSESRADVKFLMMHTAAGAQFALWRWLFRIVIARFRRSK